MFIVLEMSLVFQRSRNSSSTFIFLSGDLNPRALRNSDLDFRSVPISSVQAFLEKKVTRGNERKALRCERLLTLYVSEGESCTNISPVSHNKEKCYFGMETDQRK